METVGLDRRLERVNCGDSRLLLLPNTKYGDDTLKLARTSSKRNKFLSSASFLPFCFSQLERCLPFKIKTNILTQFYTFLLSLMSFVLVSFHFNLSLPHMLIRLGLFISRRPSNKRAAIRNGDDDSRSEIYESVDIFL